jgi:phosphoserine phosphatase
MADAPAISDSGPPFGAVAFDCDSTLSSIEGIDELAGERRGEIATLTARAMRGDTALESVYRARLEIVRPTRAAVEALGRAYVASALPHGRELVAALRALEKRVCIVTGGLQLAVAALARHLGVGEADVYAVEVYFDRSGAYAGFDELSPLATGHGKLEVLRGIARDDRRGGVAFVGDGATDLAAAPAARRFVAFGGVVARAEVIGRAAVACRARDLAALLPLLASRDEIDLLARDPRHAALIAAAREALKASGGAA